MPIAEALINAPEFTVSELSSALKRTVEDTYGHVRVRGEISGFRGPHSSGHCYFALKDENAKIEAVMGEEECCLWEEVREFTPRFLARHPQGRRGTGCAGDHRRQGRRQEGDQVREALVELGRRRRQEARRQGPQ